MLRASSEDEMEGMTGEFTFATRSLFEPSVLELEHVEVQSAPRGEPAHVIRRKVDVVQFTPDDEAAFVDLLQLNFVPHLLGRTRFGRSNRLADQLVSGRATRL